VRDEVERLEPVVGRIEQETAQAVRAAEKSIAPLPGAAARCRSCQARMQLKRAKRNRTWSTFWRCPECGTSYKTRAFPRHRIHGGWV
jgi:ribosomal protein L37AE/L43A